MTKNHQNRLSLINKYLKEINLTDELKSYFYDRNILVTGGAGAIGSNLVIALSSLVGETGKIIILDLFI